MSKFENDEIGGARWPRWIRHRIVSAAIVGSSPTRAANLNGAGVAQG